MLIVFFVLIITTGVISIVVVKNQVFISKKLYKFWEELYEFKEI